MRSCSVVSYDTPELRARETVLLPIEAPQRPGTIPRFPRDLFWRGQFHEGAVMGGLYLGIAVTGVNALIATGLVIALM